MKKPGPKRIQINWEEFDKLCHIQATLNEIAWWFKCSEDTIERAVKREFHEKFADLYKKKSAGGKLSLRRKMFENAMSGNTTMQIFLSKQFLGYSDKIEEKREIKSQAEITWSAEWTKPTDEIK